MTQDFFIGIKQWEFIHEGLQGKLPVFYYDTTSITAIYTASTSMVKKLLPLPQMTPVELLPGRSLVVFTAFEYRQTDIDPYNEFSMAFPITYNKPQIPFFTAATQMLRRCFSAYVWQLPVTTEVARIGGVDLYGYPKFLADIEFHKENHRIHCNVAENGNNILSMSGNLLPTTRGKITRFITYSVLDSIPLVANVYINPIELAHSRNKQSVTLEIGTDHSICNDLLNIGLSSTPVQYQYSPLNQGILFGGRNLMDH